MGDDEIIVQDKPKDNVSKIYEYLKQNNVVVPDDEEIFRKSLQNKENSDKIHSFLKSKEVVVPDSQEEFYTSLKKKELADQGQETGSNGSPEPGKPSSKSTIITDQQRKDISKIKFEPHKYPEIAQFEREKKKADEQALIEFATGDKEKPNEFFQIANDPKAAIDQSIKSFNKAIIQSAASIPKSVAIIAKPIDKFFGINTEKPIQEYATYKAGQWLEDKAIQWGITATDPERDQSFWQSTIPNALGSVAAIALTGGKPSGNLLEGAALTQKEAIMKGLQETGQSLTSPGSIVGSTSMAVPEFEAAKRAGATDDEAFKVWAKNYFVGTTEILPIERGLERINKLSGGKLIDIVKAGVPQAIEEGTQETVQQILQNKIAQGSYDPERDTFTDVLQSGGAGFFVGFILPGIGAAMQHMTPEQQQKTKAIINTQFKNLATGDTGLTTEQKAQPTDEVIQDQTKAVDKTDVASIEAASKVIQEKVDQNNQQENASTILQDQGAVPQGGQAVEGSQENRGNDVQQNQEPQQKVNAEVEQQGGLKNPQVPNEKLVENSNLPNNGNEIPESVPQGELGSGNETHSRIQEASDYIERGTATSAEELNGLSKSDSEKVKALQYAKAKNIWVDDLYSLGQPLKGGGNENVLAYNQDEQTIYKSNNLSNSGNSIGDFLNQVKYHNEIFPESKYELVGFTGTEPNNENRVPYVEPIINQHFVGEAEQASPNEISEYMQSLGFKKINEDTFTNDKYTISDLKPRNVLKNKAGQFFVIDNIIKPNSESSKPELGERQTAKKIAASKNMPDPVKQEAEYLKEYEIRHNADEQKKASDWIDKNGEDEAINSITNGWPKAMSQLQQNAIRIELIDRLGKQLSAAEKSGDTKLADTTFKKMQKVLKNSLENITDQAQALQLLGTLEGILSTEGGALRFATKEIEQSREQSIRNFAPIINNAKQIINEINKLSREELLSSPKVQDLINEFKQKNEALSKKLSKDESVKIFGKTKEQAISDRKKATEDLNKLLGSSARSGIDPKAIELLGKIAYNRVIESGISLIEFINEISAQYPGKFTHQDIEKSWNLEAKDAEDKIIKNSTQKANEKIVKNIIEPKEKKEKTFEQKKSEEVKRAIKKSIDADILKAIDDFNHGDTKAFDNLANKLASDLGVKESDVKKFSDAIKKLAEQKRQEIKEKIVNKYLPKDKTKKATKQKKEFYDKVVELSDKGVLSESDFEEQLATIFKLPSMTKEVASKIQSLVQNIKKAPEGKFRNIETIKMMDYIAQQQKFNLTNYLIASYKAGLFSGIDTQAINNISNVGTSLAYIFESTVFNPKEGLRLLKALTNPTSAASALNEALLLMKTGIDPRQINTSQRALEQTRRSFLGFGKGLTGKKLLLDPTLEAGKKYVFRALSAGDILFSQTLSDQAQEVMFRRVGIKQGLRGEELETFITDEMGLDEENQKAALQQATQEYNDGRLGDDFKNKDRIIKARRNEIIEQGRDKNVVARAKDFAGAQIFTSPPKGYFGIIANILNQAIKKIPLLNALIPVVNIGANITQRGVEYTPPFALLRGAVHYAADMSQGVSLSTLVREDFEKLKSGDPFMEQRVKRFTTGLITMVATLALFHQDDDDEDNLISRLTGHKIILHGGGPGSLLKNMAPTYQKEETGWKPYTLQIDGKYYRYDLAPGYNVLLATMGEYYDAVRYGKLDKKTASERLGFALVNSSSVILRNGFIQSLTGSLDALMSMDFKKFVNTLVIRPASGFVFPKFQRNLANFFDNKVYSAHDIEKLATRSIPILAGYTNEPILNSLGEPVEKNWWERVELWSSQKENMKIWDQMDEKNYSLPQPNQYNLSQSLKRDVDDKTFNKFFIYRGREIKKIFEQHGKKLNKIKDKDIYEATLDNLVLQASETAKHDIGKDNGWLDVQRRFDHNYSYDYPVYEMDEKTGNPRKKKY